MNIESIAILSDVSIGYGSPQIISLARSLAEFFKAEVVIFEPDQPDRPPAVRAYPDLKVRRIYTASHPYSAPGQIDYTIQLSDELRRANPDMVVVCAFHGAAALLKSGVGKFIVYYGYEHTDGILQREMRTVSMLADRIDCAIYCEENRAYLDAPRLGLEGKPSAIVYNCSDISIELNSSFKNDRIIYAGQIDPVRTYGKLLFGNEFDEFPLDVYGAFRNYPDAIDDLDAAKGRGSSVSYCGELPHGPEFIKLVSTYSFSFVAWNPLSESTYYAAPNKFFDAIAAGTPPLCAPHPLCVRILQRYDCGRLLPGWHKEDFKRGIGSAMKFSQTDEYEELKQVNLVRAAKDLTWKNQFKKFTAIFERVVGERA